MSAVWLLSTRHRQEGCQAVLDACESTGMRSRGVVYVDGDPYPSLRLPGNWTKVEGRRWGGVRAGMRWVLRKFPDASAYGWLADDTFPQTEDWDREVEEAAGEWNIAYCRDGWLSESAESLKHLESGGDLSSGICWGGELVRTIGWWAPPGLRQGGIDYVWTQLVEGLDLTRYLPEVSVRHYHWRNSSRTRDEVDLMPHVQEDVEAAFAYLESADFRRVRRRLTRALGHRADDRRTA